MTSGSCWVFPSRFFHTFTHRQGLLVIIVHEKPTKQTISSSSSSLFYYHASYFGSWSTLLWIVQMVVSKIPIAYCSRTLKRSFFSIHYLFIKVDKNSIPWRFLLLVETDKDLCVLILASNHYRVLMMPYALPRYGINTHAMKVLLLLVIKLINMCIISQAYCTHYFMYVM